MYPVFSDSSLHQRRAPRHSPSMTRRWTISQKVLKPLVRKAWQLAAELVTPDVFLFSEFVYVSKFISYLLRSTAVGNRMKISLI